jgi:ABC-type branched-subunit amino acid transport system permease subunit
VLLAVASELTRSMFSFQGLSLVLYGTLLVIIIAFLPNGLIELFQRKKRKETGRLTSATSSKAGDA